MMKVHFDFVEHRSDVVHSSEYDSIDDFKANLGFVLEEHLVIMFDSASIILTDDDGTVVSIVSLQRAPTFDNVYDVSVSVVHDDETVRITVCRQSIWMIWHYFGLCDSPFAPPSVVEYENPLKSLV